MTPFPKDFLRVSHGMYGSADTTVSVTSYQAFQMACCEKYEGPILNAACGTDPCGLHRYGVINLDAFDPEEPTTDAAYKPRKRVPNFVKGSVFDLPYPDEHFRTVVLGEFIEHCKYEAAVKALKECRRVLVPKGHLILTFPQDGTPRDDLVWFDDGKDDGFAKSEEVTLHHQTFWSERLLWNLFQEANLAIEHRHLLVYSWVNPLCGWGMVLRKDEWREPY